MAYEVQLIHILSIDSILLPSPLVGSIVLQNQFTESATRTVSFPNSTEIPVIFSNVRIKRPDGTWAYTVQVGGVHLRLPDGTWQVFL